MKSTVERVKRFFGLHVGNSINLLSGKEVPFNELIGIGAEMTGVIYRGVISQVSTSSATKTKELNPYNFTVGYAESSGAIDLTFATTETPAPNFAAGDLIVKAHFLVQGTPGAVTTQLVDTETASGFVANIKTGAVANEDSLYVEILRINKS